MEIQEFCEKVQKAVATVLGEEYHVKLQEIRKNNGVYLQGLIIQRERQNVSPTIYLQPFWNAYKEGLTLLEVVTRIIQIYREDVPRDSIDMSFFKEFDRVKERICFRLIHAGQNSELLEDIPYIPFMDLAICFYYAYEGELLGNGSILIHNSHMNMWRIGVKELMDCAKRNTPVIFPWECGSMELTLRELEQQMDSGESMVLPSREDGDGIKCRELLPLYILTNRQRVYGAACILYTDLLAGIAEGMKSGFYILPSSVHEVILLVKHEENWGKQQEEQLKRMIADVNRTQLEPEEVLSENLYYYDWGEKKIKIV